MQQFNTTSSMGRLTLNVLLSFAQFEREVTAECIRDKIAASKKKGMWMGGNPHKLAEILFTAYFTGGRDLSDPAVLKAIAAEAGLPADRADAVVDDGEGTREVRVLEAEARREGIKGVSLLRIAMLPFWEPAGVMADALRRAAKPETLAAE
jgi:predicted DsbA family dithiol-disulfide isomerase